VNHGEQQNNKN